MNVSRVRMKLREIEESVEIIQEHLPGSAEEFSVLGIVKDGIYKRLEFCIQNLLDIFSMIYTDLKIGVPSSQEDVLDGLAARKVFSRKIVGLVRDMKGMRNILAHRYGKIDDGPVFLLLNEKIEDFDEVVSAIEKYMAELRK